MKFWAFWVLMWIVFFVIGAGFLCWWHSCPVTKWWAQTWWFLAPALVFNGTLIGGGVLGYLVVVNYQKWRA